MRRSFLLAGALALATVLGPSARAADCILPGPAPAPPRGAVATLEEMQQGQKAIQSFVNALEAYQACLLDKAKNAPPDTTKEVTAAWLAQGNAAIDEAQELKILYQEQVQLYKKRTVK